MNTKGKVETAGEVRIHTEAINCIARQCALSTPGITGIAETGFLGRLRTGDSGGGVRCSTIEEDQTAQIEIHVVVDGERPIPEVAKQLQTSISDVVATMTNLNVAGVNIYVEGIRTSAAAQEALPVEDEAVSEDA